MSIEGELVLEDLAAVKAREVLLLLLNLLLQLPVFRVDGLQTLLL